MPTSMATVLLSLASNSLHWGLISSDLGPLAGRLVHPTAPVLLTKSGPLGTPIRGRGRAKLGRPGNFAHWKFENGLRPLRPQHP